MSKYLISVNDLPPDGKDFLLEDQNIWLDPLREFKMDCKIVEPLKSSMKVIPAEDGFLIRGKISGGVVVPCNRCAEDAHVEIMADFDEFEEIPHEQPKGQKNSEAHVVFDRNSPMLDLGEIAWEQFMLAMPPRPLCKNDCKGLCPQCGINLNLEECSCSDNDGDDRMAVLRGLKLNK